MDKFLNTKKELVIVEKSKFNSFYELLKPYKNMEMIPVNIIKDIIKNAFESAEILHEYNSYHLILKVKIKDLLEAPVTNWKYNRPPDMTRCNDIARYIYLSKNNVDTMFYLNFNNISQTFDIIDGIHRLTSLRIIHKENKKPLDLLTPSEFGNNSDAIWLYDSYVMLNIRINSVNSDLIELFQTLNKSHPIPDLYIRDTKKDKKDIIENIVNNWQIKYKSHFSSSSKPQKPNVNRDRFIDLLDHIYEKYKIKEDNKELLEELLYKANTNISFNLPPKISEKILEKCENSGLWLFIYTNEKLEKII